MLLKCNMPNQHSKLMGSWLEFRFDVLPTSNMPD